VAAVPFGGTAAVETLVLDLAQSTRKGGRKRHTGVSQKETDGDFWVRRYAPVL